MDRGLTWFHEGKKGTAWESTVDDLDRFQLLLNQQGIHSIHRNYRFELLKPNKIPHAAWSINPIATRQRWPEENIKLKNGDVADIYCWKDGEYVNFAFRKGE